MTQTWNKLLFAHWPVTPEELRPLLPSQVSLDTFNGQAWIGIVPFSVTNVRARGLPPIPGLASFLEMNVRTYVTKDDKPGVWFFSLDASHPLMVEGARQLFSLAYFKAGMTIQSADQTVHYASERKDQRGGEGKFKATYRPVGEVFNSRPGTLEYFLTERYCLYTLSKRDILYRAQIHHRPWPLQMAEVTIEANTLTKEFGILLPEMPPLLYYSERQPMLTWYLEKA
jgi:uncharacterized protein